MIVLYTTIARHNNSFLEHQKRLFFEYQFNCPDQASRKSLGKRNMGIMRRKR